MKRLAEIGDFSFLSVLWDMAKNPRNGCICDRQIPSLMREAGFSSRIHNNGHLDFDVWSHPSLYREWGVDFRPIDGILEIHTHESEGEDVQFFGSKEDFLKGEL